MAQPFHDGAHGPGRLDQRRGHVACAHHGGTPRAEDPGFLARNRVEGGAEIFLVVEADADHDGDARLDDVDRVEPPAQSHLEHPHVELGGIEQQKTGERVVLEERERHRGPGGTAGTGCLDALEDLHQRLARHHRPVDANAFAIVAQVRRSKGTDAMARGREHGRAVGRHRALAVGARHRDHRHPRLPPAEACEQVPHSVQPQIDGLRMSLGLVGQPLLESPFAQGPRSQAAAGSLPVSRRSMAPMRSRSSRRSTIMSRAPCSSRNSLR